MIVPEIAKGNKLIAEFMGEEITSDGKWQSKHNGIMDFKYHSSWEWIMPVVNEINRRWAYTDMDGDEFLQGELIIRVIREALGQVDIETVFGQVVKFIEWHNQNIKHDTKGNFKGQ